MKFVYCLITLSLCLLIENCNTDEPVAVDSYVGVYINIGDYENKLETWNKMNTLDYLLFLKYHISYVGEKGEAWVTVKNGIPESSDPPEWLAEGKISSVDELFSYIKNEVIKRETDASIEKARWVKVEYNPVYPYPMYISCDYESKEHAKADMSWTIYVWWLQEEEGE